jgi:carboxypeptidase family protein
MRKLRRTLAVVACLGAVLAAPSVAAAANGSIEGTVTRFGTGQPLSEVEVCAFEGAGFIEGCAETNFIGEYRIEEPAGEYKVEFEPFGEFGYFTQWYSGQSSFATANLVSVAEGVATENINAVLRSRNGAISGTVTDAGNAAPVGGIEVCASQTGGEGFGFGCERTNPAGQYELAGLPEGSYRVSFSTTYKYNEVSESYELEGPNYVTQFYSGQAHSNTATPVSVVAGLTTGNVNAGLQRGATITGNVSDAVSNGALQGISVCAWGASEYLCAETDKNGNYSIPALPAGSYKVEFAPFRFYDRAAEKEGREGYTRGEYPLIDYATQYWNDKASFEAAEAVNATAGGTVSGINAKMAKQIQPPPPVPTPGTAVVGPTAKVKNGKAALSVKCEGAGACAGSLQLTAKAVTTTKVKNGKAKKKVHTAVIGKANFSVPAGKTKTVTVKLNGAGKVLVQQAGAKGVKAAVSGKGVKSGSVKLVGPPAPKKKAKKPVKH